LAIAKTLTKKGFVQDANNKRIEIPVKLQLHGLTYFTVHEFTANHKAINAVMFPEQEAKQTGILEQMHKITKPAEDYKERFLIEAQEIKQAATVPLTLQEIINKTREQMQLLGIASPLVQVNAKATALQNKFRNALTQK
jgi:hypothetical protein